MNKISILDCTLRDGGYINNWNFTNDNINNIVKSLILSNVEQIEFGFISQTKGMANSTLFESFDAAETLLQEVFYNMNQKDNCTSFCVMINVGEYNIHDLPVCTEDTNIKGIRLAFHKKQIYDALNDAKIIIEKGYKLFVQPMVTLSYTNDELIDLLSKFCSLNPYALYIVDSFGSMQGNELSSILQIFESIVPRSVSIGFHAHNNLQLAFSNALTFIEKSSFQHNILIDSSIMGMGRGAGNLNTELLCDHLSKFHRAKYNLINILSIIDSDFEYLKRKFTWGYKVAYFLSATCKCHPNYGTFFTEKRNLSINNIFKLLDSIPQNIKTKFDKQYAEDLFINFQNKLHSKSNYKTGSILLGSNRPVLIIASGKSVEIEVKKINKFIENKNPVIFVVNHHSNIVPSPDYYFFSNQNRFFKFKEKVKICSTIITSNIESNPIDSSKGLQVVDYNSLIKMTKHNTSNVSLLLVKFLSKFEKVTQVYFAGLDGFNPYDIESNYSYNESHITNKSIMEQNNELLIDEFNFISNDLLVKTITSSLIFNKSFNE